LNILPLNIYTPSSLLFTHSIHKHDIRGPVIIIGNTWGHTMARRMNCFSRRGWCVCVRRRRPERRGKRENPAFRSPARPDGAGVGWRRREGCRNNVEPTKQGDLGFSGLSRGRERERERGGGGGWGAPMLLI
jgi:hypothetical protein